MPHYRQANDRWSHCERQLLEWARKLAEGVRGKQAELYIVAGSIPRQNYIRVNPSYFSSSSDMGLDTLNISLNIPWFIWTAACLHVQTSGRQEQRVFHTGFFQANSPGDSRPCLQREHTKMFGNNRRSMDLRHGREGREFFHRKLNIFPGDNRCSEDRNHRNLFPGIH